MIALAAYAEQLLPRGIVWTHLKTSTTKWYQDGSLPGIANMAHRCQRSGDAIMALAVTTLTTSMTSATWHLIMYYVSYWHYLAFNVLYAILASPGIPPGI